MRGACDPFTGIDLQNHARSRKLLVSSRFTKQQWYSMLDQKPLDQIRQTLLVRMMCTRKEFTRFTTLRVCVHLFPFSSLFPPISSFRAHKIGQCFNCVHVKSVSYVYISFANRIESCIWCIDKQGNKYCGLLQCPNF